MKAALASRPVRVTLEVLDEHGVVLGGGAATLIDEAPRSLWLGDLRLDAASLDPRACTMRILPLKSRRSLLTRPDHVRVGSNGVELSARIVND